MMIGGIRDPLPDEARKYLAAVQARDEQAFMDLFGLYPNVLWGNVSQTLSAEDRQWTSSVLQKHRNTERGYEW
jgi:hypothetical protein